MSKERAEAWKSRWELVEAQHTEELRSESFAVKFRQHVALLQFARETGWLDAAEPDVEEIRERWRRLREAAQARPASR